MFKEISKSNSRNEKGLALINTDDIAGMTEIHTEPVRLYDENGDLVSETPSDKAFVIALKNGKNLPFTIDEPTYTELKDLLLKQ